MTRNEYRRAFIMLRPAEQGYGGHVRLERRTLTGSMYFVVTAPQGEDGLTALLAGRRDGAYFAAPVGRLTRDRRGQLTLAWQFDPRNVDGRPLEAYAWVAIASPDGRSVVLTGNMEGSRSLDLAALRRAVTDALEADDAPAADLPGSEAFLPANADCEPADRGNVGTSRTAPREAAKEGELQGDVKIYTPARTRAARSAAPEPPCLSRAEAGEDVPAQEPEGSGEAACEVSGSGKVEAEEWPRQATESEGEGEERCPGALRLSLDADTASELPPEAASGAAGSEKGRTEGLLRDAAFETPAPDENVAGETSRSIRSDTPTPDADGMEARVPETAADASASEDGQPTRTAAQCLGLDITAPWPSSAEPLRRLFATLAPAETDLDDGYVYVAESMPAQSGYACCLLGLKAENGRPVAVRYALPARFTPEPPVGLEEYRWREGGGGSGWWVLDEAVESGAK